tara:strand:- start:733 stop:1794 length:1062 start_codon:yes stop_codon:yes gene_type:complete
MESFYTRTVFLDSSVNKNGDGIDASWTNNDGTLSVQGNDKFLKMTLQTLSLYRNFYTINYTNNRFYMTGFLGVVQPVVIPDGEYATLADIAAAVQVAIIAVGPGYPGITCIYDPTSRKFIIDMSAASPAPWNPGVDRFLAFCDPANEVGTSGVLPVDKGPYGMFNDSSIIMGGVPNRNANGFPLADMFEQDPLLPNVYFSYFPAMLGSLDEVVVRCQTPGVNMSSYGYDVSTGSGAAGLINNAALVPSNILARIPIRETSYFAPTAYIQYVGDGDETFSMLLGVKSLNTIRLILTDSRGRPLPQAGLNQAKIGNLSFRCSLRIDYLQSVLPQTSRVLQPQDLILQQNIALGQE